jgi:hypothetical protein
MVNSRPKRSLKKKKCICCAWPITSSKKSTRKVVNVKSSLTPSSSTAPSSSSAHPSSEPSTVSSSAHPSSEPSTVSSPLPSLPLYFFWEQMKKKMSKKPKGGRNCCQKRLLLKKFPETEFFNLFERLNPVQVAKVWKINILSQEEVDLLFPVTPKIFRNGSIGSLAPPISFSFGKSLSIKFYYEVRTEGKLVDWMDMSLTQASRIQ